MKILHIGHTYTPHVSDVIKQIKDHVNFEHAIISCTPERFMPKEFFSDIPIYDYNYLNYLDTKEMRAVVDKAIAIEKPDLIIGHSFSQVAVILNYAMSVTNVPAMAFIWGASDCIKNLKTPRFSKIFYDNLCVLSKINYLVCTNAVLNKAAVASYGITLDDFVEACPPVNLAQYTNHIPDVSKPRLLLGKPRGEQYIYPCLLDAFKAFPKLEVSAFHVPKGVELAKKFGVYKKINYYIGHQLPEVFSNIIKKNNIVHTITPDPGTGSTAMQATYAGCINLMRRCSTSAGMIEDNINALMCDTNVKSVRNRLFYAIENLAKLSKKFKENSKHLIRYDQENTWKNLYTAILNCMDGKKGKIKPKNA